MKALDLLTWDSLYPRIQQVQQAAQQGAKLLSIRPQGPEKSKTKRLSLSGLNVLRVPL
jgi:hypothetical protein